MQSEKHAIIVEASPDPDKLGPDGSTQPITPDVAHFQPDLFQAELEEISRRRAKLGLTPVVPSHNAVPNPKFGLVGLALSGGGIRSATFNLGLLQALAEADLLKSVDYLSTVSGGGYVGGCLTSLIGRSGAGPERARFPFLPADGQPPALTKLRNSVDYLAPEPFIGRIALATSLARGALINFISLVPYVIIVVIVVSLACCFIYPTAHPNRSSGEMAWIPIPADPATTILPRWLVYAPLVMALLIWLAAALWPARRQRNSSLEQHDLSQRRFAKLTLICAILLTLTLQPAMVFWSGSRRTLWEHVSLISVVLIPAALVGVIGILHQLRTGRGVPLLFLATRFTLIAIIYLVFLYGCIWVLFSHPPAWMPDRLVPNGFTRDHVWQILKFSTWFLGILIVKVYWPRISANNTSMHRFYHARLRAAYLFALTPDGKVYALPQNETRMAEMNNGGTAPYHLINATLNLHGSSDPAVRQRKSESFIFSKYFTGSIPTGYCRTRHMEAADAELDLGTAMAISGAAVSPQMGNATIGPLVSLMALLNLRLAYWLPNPRVVSKHISINSSKHFQKNGPGPLYFIWEMLGLLNEERDYLHLSDGGHHENLGALELLRRRCQLIIVSDAEEDPQRTFHGLRRLLLRSSDVSARIDIDTDSLALRDATTSAAHYVIGSITYEGGAKGTLVYVKASLTGDEGPFILGYQRNHPAFPHEATSQQFYEEEQFECYRKLGHHIASHLCNDETACRQIWFFSDRTSPPNDDGSIRTTPFERLLLACTSNAALSRAHSSGAPQPCFEKLFGRTQLLDDIASRVISGRNNRIVIAGPSGIGKSEFQRSLRLHTRLKDSQCACAYYEIGSAPGAAQDILSGNRFLATLLNQLLFDVLINCSKAREALDAMLAGHGGTSFVQTVVQLLSVLSPEFSISPTLLDIQLPSGRDQIVKRTTVDDLLAGFLSIIDTLAACGVSGVILLDRVEYATEGIQRIATVLATELPGSWGCVLAVNDETAEGAASLRTLLPPIKYHGGELVQVPPMTSAAVTLWYETVRKTTADSDALETVVRNCQGRPLLIADWVNGFVTTEHTASLVGHRLNAYYDQRLSALPGDAQWLLYRLSLLPALARVSVEFCQILLEAYNPHITLDNAWGILRQLDSKGFLSKLGAAGIDASFTLIHEATRNQVRSLLPGDVARQASAEILAAIEQRPEVLAPVLAAFTKLTLAEVAQRHEEIRATGLATANSLMKLEAYGPALEVFGLTLRLVDRDHGDYPHLLCGRADLRIKMGLYSDAILDLTRAESVPISVPIQARIDLLRGEALTRLNRYEEAKTCLARAGNAFNSFGDLEGEIRVGTRINTILRDMGLYAEAVTHADQLVIRAVDAATPSSVGDCFRALARSLALLSDCEGSLTAGRKALAIAQAANSIRAEGNAKLALGEAFRHGRRYAEALPEYRCAVAIADRIGNTDSLLWSLLGLSDALLLSGKIEEAVAILSRAEEFVESAPARYPLEHLHWRFSTECLEFLNHAATPHDLEQTAALYRLIGIHWPRQYVQNLLANGAPNGPKHL